MSDKYVYEGQDFSKYESIIQCVNSCCRTQ